MRQDKTLKVIDNHYLAGSPLCELRPMAGNDKAVMWIANDFSDGVATEDKLAGRCPTIDCKHRKILYLNLMHSAQYIQGKL